ncbi:MAG TPA: retropepsin-like aspartic protease [Opitutaceae bacterium]|nr:retropepsin-like aspartic protease [Opitutaceae bacterium]
MTSPSRLSPPLRSCGVRVLPRLFAAGLVVLLAGCATFRRPPRRTSLESAQSVLKASLISNFLVIETPGDKHGPFHFIIDTGSSATLVTPDLAKRFGARARGNQAPVRVLGANGQVKQLNPVTLKRLDLGSARFEGVAALEHDLADLSNHLGVRIDGILGFPLFRDTLLTLDYVHAEVRITPHGVPMALPGVTIPFNNEQNTPLIPIQLGAESFIALVDSNSDAALSLNTVGLHPSFQYGPKAGALVATLAGDRLRMVGRLAQPLTLGAYVIENPIVDMTDELSSIGGGLLRNFAVTFDQKRNQVTFFRPTFDPVKVPPLRSTGLSFTKTAAYWRVAAVVAESAAEQLGVQGGDLCTRINDEPVSAWPLPRYEELIHSAARITYTFIEGNQEQQVTLPVFDLVP